MTDPYARMLKLHREIIAAQTAQVEAMRQGLNAAGDLAKMQQAGLKAAEAQQAAWSSWMKMWGWK